MLVISHLTTVLLLPDVVFAAEKDLLELLVHAVHVVAGLVARRDHVG